jgi:hypothetical protein
VEHDVAFVLLREARELDPSEVALRYREIAPEGPRLLADVEEASTTFRLGRREVVTLLMPGPVPANEADEAARFSVAALGTDWKLAAHRAHVTVMTAGPLRTADRALFTRVVAAIADAAGALGVYWPAGHVTHPTELFVEYARTDESLCMLWNGVSLAGDGPGRLSLLSLGLRALGLPEVLVTAPRAEADEALDRLRRVLVRVVGAGSLDGEDVRMAPSPIDPEDEVARIDLP